MADWNKNNAACRSTWGTLRVMEQTRKTFPHAGAVPMRELAWWNPAATAAMRREQATALARQLDNAFVFVSGAAYEDGMTSAKAVKDMVAVLTVEDRTIADLAEVNDANYQFLGEV